jgi:predicted GIY-YIG superfamily endonuclease
MSWKIYLIKHLDTDMKYVGITNGDLKTRWQQHCKDRRSAVYKALRTESYRMTMELLEEVATKPKALEREQDFIRSLGTATPSGWNQRVNLRPSEWNRHASMPYSPSLSDKLGRRQISAYEALSRMEQFISPAPTKAVTTATAEDAFLRQASLL